jgi:asparagine synthase (glutamine-hydrolysing)
MCGILGIVDRVNKVDKIRFKQMLQRLNNRGPDGSGVESLDKGQVLLGHRRLAILDLSDSGKQPMCNEDRNVWLTFNGEIYNYQELRVELISLGHRFFSKADSEAIIHAYEEWGEQCIHRLNGIFAFALWDERDHSLFLARDHLGVKPLYYAQDRSQFIFASNSSAITPALENRQIDDEAFAEFLAFSYIPSDKSIWRSVKQLPPGTTLKLQDGSMRCATYWKPTQRVCITDFDEAVEALSDELGKAVSRQLQSDVPVGTLLSGGIDSTMLTALASKYVKKSQQPIHSFTLGFDDTESDEREFADIAARHYHSNHHTFELDIASFPRSLAAAIEAFDEPFDMNGPMPATAVAELVKKHGVKVVLGGDGGDELFAGYLRYDQFNCYTQKKLSLKERMLDLISPRRRSHLNAAQYFTYEGVAIPSALDSILSKELAVHVRELAMARQKAAYDCSLDPVTAAQISDLKLYLPGHILTKVDRATMYHGVEARVPFLDRHVVETALSISPKLNYRNTERKAVLKQVSRGLLPDVLISNRKKGFSSPLGKWSTPTFYKWAEGLIQNGLLVGQQIVRPDALIPVKQGIFPKTERIIWLLLSAELWAKRWFSADCNFDIEQSLVETLNA